MPSATITGVSCDQVLNACDKALSDSQKENAILRDLNDTRAHEIERLRAKDDNWTKSWVVGLAVGVGVGLLGGAYLATSHR